MVTAAFDPGWLLHPDLAPLLHRGTPLFLVVVAGVVFAESGLLVGFFLPGDSFLFAAGLVAGLYGHPNVLLLIAVAFAAAVAGDQVGYHIGQRTGPRLFHREASRLFHPNNLQRSQRFFEEHGPKTIVLARFVPIVRTFAPVVAGASEMSYTTFSWFNIAGGAAWATAATTLGWGLGKRFPRVENFLTPAVLAIVLLSVIPTLFEARRHRTQHPRPRR